MPNKPEQQFDLFNKPVVKAPKRIFDERFMEETFGEHETASVKEPDKPSQDDSISQPESHPRRKPRPPYPEGYDGNPVRELD